MKTRIVTLSEIQRSAGLRLDAAHYLESGAREQVAAHSHGEHCANCGSYKPAAEVGLPCPGCGSAEVFQ